VRHRRARQAGRGTVTPALIPDTAVHVVAAGEDAVAALERAAARPASVRSLVLTGARPTPAAAHVVAPVLLIADTDDDSAFAVAAELQDALVLVVPFHDEVALARIVAGFQQAVDARGAGVLAVAA
jgi:pimeloyl-ACP methyl ester carboxylesterase